MHLFRRLSIGLALTVLLLSGCTRQAANVASTADEGSLSIKGSDTMVHLVTAEAEAYMAAHSATQISITGGGSGTGIAAMLNGTTDLCMASRKVKEKETQLAADKKITFHEVVVGRDGIAVVVHPDNPVKEMTMDQLRKIFNGTTKSWKDVGGPDEPIQVLSRESNSGTYVFFAETVLKKDDYGSEVRLMPSTSAIVQSTAQDKWSIGYVGLGYTRGAAVTVVRVKADESAPAVQPSLETVRDGSYPIARPLLIYANGEPTGLAKAFIDFILSPDGQKIVGEKGYIPLK